MESGVLSLCKRPLKKFQQPKQSEKGPRWVKDKAVFWCKCCNTDFSVVVRKHHCRHCGHVFCGHCCANKRTLIKFGYLKPVRLCNKCNASCFKADLLLNAVGLNDINTVTKICEEGCDVHFTTTVFPALTIAANRGSSDMVRVLLRYGADPNHAVPATDSGTVVQCSRCGRTQAAGNIKDNQYECSYCGNFTRHADASDSDHTGITALHAAVQKEGHLDVVVALLEHGADVDCATAKGNTALMYAAAGGHVECANVVLEYGANANVRSEADSDTPIHKAVREGHMEVVKLLLRHRADLASTNIAGLTPLQLAERCKRAQIAALLQGIETNGYTEEMAAPSKVPAPLVLNDVKASAGALTGGKTFEELMNIKSDPTPTDWETPKNVAPVVPVEDADDYEAQGETQEAEGGGETERLKQLEDADEPVDFSQVNIDGDAHERAEALLARLEMEEASEMTVPAVAPVAEGEMGDGADEATTEVERDEASASAAGEAGEAAEEGGEGADEEISGEAADGLVFKGKPKKGKKKK